MIFFEGTRDIEDLKPTQKAKFSVNKSLQNLNKEYRSNLFQKKKKIPNKIIVLKRVNIYIFNIGSFFKKILILMS